MAITAECGACGLQTQAPNEFAGRRIKCKCGEPMMIPAAAPPGLAPGATPAPGGAEGRRAPSALGMVGWYLAGVALNLCMVAWLIGLCATWDKPGPRVGLLLLALGAPFYCWWVAWAFRRA